MSETVHQPRSVLQQASEVIELAHLAFDRGNLVGGLAAIKLAAQLVQLAKIQRRGLLPLDSRRDSPA